MNEANAPDGGKPAERGRVRPPIAERATPGMTALLAALFAATDFALAWADPFSRWLLGSLWVLLALLVSIAEASMDRRTRDSL